MAPMVALEAEATTAEATHLLGLQINKKMAYYFEICLLFTTPHTPSGLFRSSVFYAETTFCG